MRELAALGISRQQKIEFYFKFRKARLYPSKTDYNCWDNFIAQLPGTSFPKFIKTWNDYLSLLMTSRTTYQALNQIYLQDMKYRKFYAFWFSKKPLPFWFSKKPLPPSLEQKYKICYHSGQGFIFSYLYR